jgi:hypothetical protein
LLLLVPPLAVSPHPTHISAHAVEQKPVQAWRHPVLLFEYLSKVVS